MRKILLPTDFSKNAQNALAYAISLFNEPTAFYLLHAYASEVFTTKNTSLSEKELEALKKETGTTCEKKLKEQGVFIQKIKNNPNHTFQYYAKCGFLLDEINDIITNENIDVLVMGTRGQTNDRNITFGSNTLQVLKQVRCPVLCVPEGFQFDKPKKILFPTNYMVPYQKEELQLVHEISTYYQSELFMLYISDFDVHSHRQKKNRVHLKKELETVALHFKHLKASGKTNAINQWIEEHDIDLLVMVNSRHSFLENLLEPSTIDKISLHPKIPFLILQNYLKV